MDTALHVMACEELAQDPVGALTHGAGASPDSFWGYGGPLLHYRIRGRIFCRVAGVVPVLFLSVFPPHCLGRLPMASPYPAS